MNSKPKCTRVTDNTDWLPKILEADKDCKECAGWGIVDIGWYHAILTECPVCIVPNYDCSISEAI